MNGQGNNFPDLLTMLVNLGNVAMPLLSLCRYVSLICGIWFAFLGLLHWYAAFNGGTSRFMGGREQSTHVLAITYIVSGMFFTALFRMELIGSLQATLINGDVAHPINSAQLAYGAGANLNERMQAATFALLAILQTIGFIAIWRGIKMMKDTAAGLPGSSIGGVIVFLIAGTMLWHFSYFANALNNTLGYDFIGLFSPFR